MEDVEWATLTYVGWFNHTRLHTEIDMVPPAEFEQSTTVRRPGRGGQFRNERVPTKPGRFIPFGGPTVGERPYRRS